MSERNARRIRTWTATLVAITGAATMAKADTFYVNGNCGNDAWTGTSSICSAPNGPKLTIQAGIDASVNGDTVIVADGTYIDVGNKNLDYGGRLITLRSQDGPAACIIDCENEGRGVYFHNAETADAVLEGFTIRNGNVGLENGGGILCESASPTILNCLLLTNQSMEFGGGMSNSSGSSPTVTNCTFSGNAAATDGGAMYNVNSSPTVTGCDFIENKARAGAGMYIQGGRPSLSDCTFRVNSADSSGSGVGVYSAAALLLDLHEPHRIVRKSLGPILVPETDYEQEGFVPNVVFPTGVVERGDTLLLYYGAADTVCAVAELSTADILAATR